MTVNIKQLQDLLRALGFDPGMSDGLYGAKTDAALRAACAKYGISSNQPTASKAQTGTYWDEIKYFTRSEFRCPCPRCGGFPVEPAEKLARLADKVRDKCNAPAHISSGVRCQAHNDELTGSVPNSRHVKGWAMDFCVDGYSAARLDAVVGSFHDVAYHYAIDDRYVHMDIVL